MVALLAGPLSAQAGTPEAKKWVDAEFQPSTLSQSEQMAEMEWFIKAAEPFKGMEINVVSETITTHEYESKTLAKAFTEITGIKVNHDLIGEGDVIEKLQTQMQSNKNIYDAYINDSDLIGTHFRYQQAVSLTDWMAGDGQDVTNPGLDLDDFIGLSFTTSPSGELYQIPDQQFANLYWFRYDWFKRPELKKQFKEIYGYELGVPVNWSAYEDIADFFSNKVKEIDGKRVYGHMDYGKKIHPLAGVSPMPGYQWQEPEIRVFQTDFPLMNGGLELKGVILLVPQLSVVVQQMALLLFMLLQNILTG